MRKLHENRTRKDGENLTVACRPVRASQSRTRCTNKPAYQNQHVRREDRPIGEETNIQSDVPRDFGERTESLLFLSILLVISRQRLTVSGPDGGPCSLPFL